MTRLLIFSDVHYAGEAEKRRVDYELESVSNPAARLLIRFFRHQIWLRDPFGHNHLLDRILRTAPECDLAVVNGDYSCDSGFIGVADDPSLQSAEECLGKIRSRFPGRAALTFGDHELGKVNLSGELGSMRLESWRRCLDRLKLAPAWKQAVPGTTFIGVASSIVAFPILEAEALPEERAEWWEIRRQHLAEIEGLFRSTPRDHRILLFCHDPTALPFLARLDAVRERIHQIDRTIIGHLHTPLVFAKSGLLAGMPRIDFMGASIKRITSALNQAKLWKEFNVLLCPSPAGCQLAKDGGYYTAEIPSNGGARFTFHPLAWAQRGS